MATIALADSVGWKMEKDLGTMLELYVYNIIKDEKIAALKSP